MPSAQDLEHFGIGMLYGAAVASVGYLISIGATARSPRVKWAPQSSAHECEHTVAEAIEDMAAQIYTNASDFTVMIRRVRAEGNISDRWEAALEAVDQQGGRIYLEYTNGVPIGHGSRMEAIKALEGMVGKTLEGNLMKKKQKLDFGNAWFEVVAAE